MNVAKHWISLSHLLSVYPDTSPVNAHLTSPGANFQRYGFLDEKSTLDRKVRIGVRGHR